MLQFNPHNRFSVKNCLASDIFNDIRNPEFEKEYLNKVECPNTINSVKEAVKYFVLEIKLLNK